MNYKMMKQIKHQVLITHELYKTIDSEEILIKLIQIIMRYILIRQHDF